MRSSYCIYSVSSPKQINQSPINRSPSKRLFSFSKDVRFRSPRQYCDKYYDIPTFLGLSSTQLPRKLSRSKLQALSSERFDNRVLNIGPTYSMHPKLKVIDKTMSIQAQNNNPGSGTYENPEALSPRSKYPTTKHRNRSITKFNPLSSVRFQGIKNRNPGPGTYRDINQLSNSGEYSLSQSTGFGKRFFDKERRVVQFEYKAKKNLNPSPDSYRYPSEFGNYDGDVYQLTGGISYMGSISRMSRRSNHSNRSRF